MSVVRNSEIWQIKLKLAWTRSMILGMLSVEWDSYAGVQRKLPAKGSLNGSWNGETPPSLFGWKSLHEANPAAAPFYKVRFFFFPICVVFSLSFFLINDFNWRLITLQYCSGFCQTPTWIHHGCTCVPHPKPPSSHLPPHPIPQGHPSAPALSTLCHASNLDWRSISHMIIYMFQCYSLKSSHRYSLKSSHPRLFPQSPTVCSL